LRNYWLMLKIGFIGSDLVARNYAAMLKGVSDVTFSGCFDYDPCALRDFCEETGIYYAPYAEELLLFSDAIIFTYPAQFDFDLIVTAVKQGKHILIEDLSKFDATALAQLIKLVNEAGVVARFVLPSDYIPAFQAARKTIRKPVFVDIRHDAKLFDSNGKCPSVESLLMQDLGILFSVVNSNVLKLSAKSFNTISPKADFINARIEFDNGCVANITSNRISNEQSLKCMFYQHSNFISIDFEHNKADISQVCNFDEASNLFNYSYSQVKTENIEVQSINPLRSMLEKFIAACYENDCSAVNLDIGLRALLIAQQISSKIKLTSTHIQG
jgi:hypothetical protein